MDHELAAPHLRVINDTCVIEASIYVRRDQSNVETKGIQVSMDILPIVRNLLPTNGAVLAKTSQIPAFFRMHENGDSPRTIAAGTINLKDRRW